MSYSFKRDTKLYAVINGVQYNLDLSEITFSQTTDDTIRELKTIQLQEFFGDVTVDSYLPAAFSFNIPAIREPDFLTFFDTSLQVSTYDLYVVTEQDTFKIEYCVTTQISWIVEKAKPLRLQIAGEARKLTREGDENFPIPGSGYIRTGLTYNVQNYIEVEFEGVNPLDGIISNTIVLQNQIEWDPYLTLDDICLDGSINTYPEYFTLKKRVLSGSVTSYRIDDLGYDEDSTLYILFGEQVGPTIYGFEFDLANIVHTRRVNAGEIFTFTYDWRLTQNPGSLLEIIKYITDQASAANAILDFWGNDILDSDGNPLLDSF